ncbi:MAG TPA: hypothetical protein VE911_10140 [Candidatus Nitrosopolaris sp.]|nr:hypothetical protein [Candidatus Nitrosopolaris sp.]
MMPSVRIVLMSLLLLLAQEVVRADMCMVRADQARVLDGDDEPGLPSGTCAMECEREAAALGNTCLDRDDDPAACEAIAHEALDDCLGGCTAPVPTCAETCEIVARAGDDAALLVRGETPGRVAHSLRRLRRCVRRCTA